ncbi:NAD(P)-binding protein [Tricholoma matsutake]|nr:NAD(P)-binding protein [Tricholoma matsutake 945]
MGLAFSSVYQHLFPPKCTYTVNDIPDLTGKVVIVTGANTGIGKETAKALLSHNAKVYIAARDQSKADLAIKDLEDQTGKESFFLKLDLADLLSVKAAAKEFESKEKELHILFNNAGVMLPPIEKVTAQGYDLQFGTNVLGHFYLTKLLMPLLLSGAKSSPDGKSRVVNVSSVGHIMASNLDFNTFKDGPARRRPSVRSLLYGQSKFGNIVFANELFRRYGDQGIVSTSVHPGNIKTDLYQGVPLMVSLVGFTMYPASTGAVTSLWAGTSVEGAKLGGKYLVPWARLGRAHAGTQDPELGKRLWEWAEEQVENI